MIFNSFFSFIQMLSLGLMIVLLFYAYYSIFDMFRDMKRHKTDLEIVLDLILNDKNHKDYLKIKQNEEKIENESD